ncbi:hypothetical protein H072_8982 [Dactylellina haptotyla CBS 200.50]|uniref:Hydrophobin n=1 Tax=Dactylellina haptotyla (strain CBS 200.50) TaxID=1284197 RepID=S8BDR7_DACHA|nr:hypothetical protein H072_8982 [Dactylellina haptotyla CBS 200.50]
MGFRSAALFLLYTLLVVGYGGTTWIPYSDPFPVIPPNKAILSVDFEQSGLPLFSRHDLSSRTDQPYSQTRMNLTEKRQGVNSTGAVGHPREIASPDCAMGMTNCAHLGRPYICCPEVLIISPMKVSMESSCFQSQISLSGVVCCQNPMECERGDHHAEDAGKIYETKCTPGFHECSAALGGGCCPEGYGCDQASCFQIFNDESPTTTESEPGLQWNSVAPMEQEPTYPCGPFAGPTCQNPPAVVDPESIGSGNSSSFTPPHRVLKAEKSYILKRDDDEGDGSSILKTGEYPDTNTTSAQYAPQIDPLDPAILSPIDPRPGPTEAAAIITEVLQSVVQDGAVVILTLTQGVDAVVTRLPAPSIPNNGTDGVNIIIGNFQSPLRSSGNSYKHTDSTLWSRTFSAKHMKYMGMFMVFQLVNGLGNRR